MELNFYVTSGVASRTGKPMITITVNGPDFTTNMSTADARALASNLLQAAEAAESDAFIFNFVHQELKLPKEQAATMLVNFRQWRDQTSET